MACNLTLTGRSLPCRDALGGVKKVWMASFSDGLWSDVASGEIPNSVAALTLHDYVSPKNTSNLVQTVNSTLEGGAVFYTQVLTLVCNKPVAEDIGEIQELARGRVAIVVQDMNDNYFVMGHIRGCELSGGSIYTGTALGDVNGFTLEFTAEELIPAPFLNADGDNLTFDETP